MTMFLLILQLLFSNPSPLLAMLSPPLNAGRAHQWLSSHTCSWGMGLWSSPDLWDQTGVLLGNFYVYFSTIPRNAQGTTASCVWMQLCEDTLEL